MRFTAIITTALGLLATAVTASPLRTVSHFTAKEFEITNLSLSRVVGGNATLSFTVHDPDPLTNATTTCGSSWKYGSSGWPTGSYKACNNDTSFAWNMASFQNWTSFTLGVEHAFKDPSIGQPPYDSVITFADAAFNSSTVSCNAIGGRESCLQTAGYVLRAPITRTAAKHR